MSIFPRTQTDTRDGVAASAFSAPALYQPPIQTIDLQRVSPRALTVRRCEAEPS